jgi:hypothetical protein
LVTKYDVVPNRKETKPYLGKLLQHFKCNCNNTTWEISTLVKTIHPPTNLKVKRKKKIVFFVFGFVSLLLHKKHNPHCVTSSLFLFLKTLANKTFLPFSIVKKVIELL